MVALFEQDYETAATRVEHALDLDPGNIPALMVKNSLTERAGNPDAAAEDATALFETYSIGPFGWTPRHLVERFAHSEAGARAFKKAKRLQRHRQIKPH
jgi:hypothetical protein